LEAAVVEDKTVEVVEEQEGFVHRLVLRLGEELQMKVNYL
tara:strand:+ start:139 stop:258 length:120 start_codon:yes stop_codon:yes gene_type:complete